MLYSDGKPLKVTINDLLVYTVYIYFFIFGVWNVTSVGVKATHSRWIGGKNKYELVLLNLMVSYRNNIKNKH